MALLSNELIEKVKRVTQKEELMQLAKENEIELTEEEAEKYVRMILASKFD